MKPYFKNLRTYIKYRNYVLKKFKDPKINSGPEICDLYFRLNDYLYKESIKTKKIKNN